MYKFYKSLTALFLLVSTLSIAQPVNGTTTFFTNTTTALAANTGCSITKTVSLDGWLFSVSSTSNCGFNQTNSTGGDGRLQYLVGFGTLTQATFGSNTGSEFALASLVWGVSTSGWTSKPMTFVGYKNGMAVPGATLNATTPSGTGITNTTTVTFSTNIAFNDVDDIALAPNSATCNTILFFEEITVGTATPACLGPTLTLTGSSNVLCNGQSNGSTTISAIGGSGITYTWSPSGGNAATASGLSAGMYTLSSTNNTCTIISTETVQITQPSALVSNTAVTNVLCNGGNGSATLTASGGTGAYTYSWSSGATASVIANPAGAYTATVTDANSCTSTKNITVAQPSALVSNTAVTNVLCNGGNGIATITASGGTGAYTYSWSSGATASVVANLAGAYTATVTDANACTSAKNITITQPSALVSNTAVTNALCNGGNGTATITSSGGTGTYTYSWSSAATTSMITNLAGVYTATVTDANNCSSTNTITITQPSALVSGTAVTNALCNAGNGSATLTAFGGTGAYTYSWSSAATTSVIMNLAGIYTVTVTDANSCTSAKNITIIQPSPIVINSAVTTVLCNGGNGSATITASGGTGAYTYSWSSAATTSVITNVAGAYTTTVTDANNCTSTKTITITQPASLLASVAIASVLCNGGTGTASITAFGGTGPYTYSWSSSASSSVMVNVTGVYTATVTDVNNCITTNTVTIMQPPALVSSTAVTNAVCNGVNGSATITVSGGAGAYTYSWSSGATTSVVSLLAGAHTATVTDANTCKIVRSVFITQPPALTLTAAPNSPSVCSGNHVWFNSNGTGGTGAITYSWTSGPTTSYWGAYPTASATYTINIFDANNCTTSRIVSVTVGYGPIITVSGGTICAGQSFQIIPSGAITYFYSGGSSNVSPSVTTTYTVNGTAANGCWNSVVLTVTVYPLPSPILSYNNYVICNGATTTITPSGANSYTFSAFSGPNSYTSIGITAIVSPTATTSYWITGMGTSTAGCIGNGYGIITVYVNSTTITVNSGSICAGDSFTMISSGALTYTYSGGTNIVSPALTNTYTVVGTGNNGCVSYEAAISQVIVHALPTLTMSNGSMCSNHSFTLNPQGASTYTYLNGGPIVSPVVTSSYAVIGSSPKRCVSNNTATAIVTVNITPTIHVSGTSSVCAGETITLIANGGNTYLWNNGSTSSLTALSPATSGNYTVVGTAANTCSSSAVHSVTVYSLPTITAADGTICAGTSFTIVPSGAASYTYSSGAAIVSPIATTSYSISGTSAQGCTATNAAVISVTVNALPPISVISTNSLICVGETVTLTVSGAITYTWGPAVHQLRIVVSPTATTNYSVVGMDDSMCANTVNLRQEVSECTGLNALATSTSEMVKIYPNPNDGLFTVEIKTAGLLVITNALGEVVLKTITEAGDQNIDLQQHAKGIYFVQVRIQGQLKVIKIIKE